MDFCDRRYTEATLLDYVAGKVRGPNGARLRAHLDDCQRCAKWVAAQKTVWHLLDEWQTEFESTSFTKDVSIRVSSLPPEPWLAQTGRFVAARVWRPAFAVTAITALFAVGLYLKNPFFVSPRDPVTSHGRALPASSYVSPVEAEQIDRAFDDLQLLHQVDTVTEGSKKPLRTM